MAYPPAYTRAYSFTDFETLNPGEPKPGDKLDTEYDAVSNALTATQTALALIQRADGELANESVGVDQLQAGLFDAIGDAAVADAEAAAAAAAASASLAAGSASSASTSASAASASAGVASGAAAQAGVSQGIAQDAANEAALSATEADAAADVSVQAANDTAGSVAATEAAVQRAFEWAELLTGPVLPAPPGWPEAVDDGMFSAKWWAIRAREYNSVDNIDLGTGGTDIGNAFDIWDAIPGNDLGLGLTFAQWGAPPHTYVLLDRSDPSNPASWYDLTAASTPPTYADPTALVGLTPVNGVSTDAMRSDSAPALSQAIVPTWTGAHTFSAAVQLNGALFASAAEGLNGQVLASQGAGQPPIWRSPGGGSVDLIFAFSTATAAADPGAQKCAFNNAAYASVTAIHYDFTSQTNFDATTILGLLTTGNRIYMQQRNDATRAAIYQVTGPSVNMGGTGWFSVPVTLVQSQGVMFANNADITSVFMLSISSGAAVANPSGLIGLTAVNGVAATALRSDGTHALDQSIVPTWTGTHTWSGAAPMLVFNESDQAADERLWQQQATAKLFALRTSNDAQSNTHTFFLATRGTGVAVSSMSFGHATDSPAFNFLGTGLTTYNGPIVMGAATGGSQGVGTINATGLFVNGVAVGSGGAAVANPTGTIGLTAVNGSAATALRSDGAPALSQAITPTWTGTHIFGKNGNASTTAAIVISGVTPALFIKDTNGGVDGKNVRVRVDAGVFNIEAGNDADTIFRSMLAANINTATPSLAFGNATDNMPYSFLGTGIITAGGVFQGPAGAVGAPTYSFSGDPDTGIFSGGGNEIAFATGGGERATLTGSQFTMIVRTHLIPNSATPLMIGNAGAPADAKNVVISIPTASGNFAIASATDASPTAFVNHLLAGTRSGTAWTNLAFGNATNNPTYQFLGTGTITAGGVILGPAGAVGAPTYSFSADPDTGMYSSGLGQIDFTSNGTQRLTISSTINSLIRVIINAASQVPLIIANSSAPVDARYMVFQQATATGSYTIATAADAATSTPVSNLLSATRSGTAWTAIAFGNATNNPTYTFLGTGLTTYSGPMVMGAPSGGSQGAGTINATGLFVNGVAVSTGAAVAGANPSANIGLTAINGSAGTFMRSDGAPALSQAITPTWTAAHTFSHSGSTAVAAINLVSAIPEILFNCNTAGTDAKKWMDVVTGNVRQWSIYDDASSAGKNYLAVTRAANVVSTMVFGNAADNPTYTYLGTGTVSAASFTSTSSRAIKRETGAPTKASSILARLRPLLYRLLAGDEREQLGLIAEEVHEVCPQLSDGKAVAYDRLAILLLAAWQEEHAEAA